MKRIALHLFSCLLLGIALLISAVSYGQVNWGAMQGVRWKPGSPARDVIVTKTPYVPSGQTQAWAENKVKTTIGANASTIDLTPANKLIKDVAGAPCRNLSETSPCVVNWKNQQYDSVAIFIDNSTISNWFLHARVTPGTNGSEFIEDMIEVIKRVKQRGAEAKLKGIMIGEHETTGTDMLQLAVTIANGINAYDFNGTAAGGTNWLVGKALSLHGGGFGAKFEGIHLAVQDFKPGTAGNQNFLTTIATKCSDFTFAFKLYKGSLDFTTTLLTVAQWKDFLYTGSGKNASGVTVASYAFDLNDVVTLFSNTTYNGGVASDYKNIIFVGDDADGTTNMFKDPKTLNSYMALRQVFDEQNWNGWMFGVPFSLKDVQMLEDDGTENPIIIGSNSTALDLWQAWKTNITNGRLAYEATIQADAPILFPNPVRSTEKLYLTTKGAQLSDIQLVTITGQRFPIRTNLENDQWVVDVSHVSPGLHILRGTLNGKAFHTNVLIQ